jgi:EpsI family protein
LSRFPKAIRDWKVIREQSIGEASMAVLQVDDYIMRNYSNSKGDILGLYIGYFRHQREGKQIHSPRQCLPGAGWYIVESKEISLHPKAHKSEKASINFYLMGKGDQQQLFLWWYHARGRIYANEYLNKLLMIWDAITKNRTDAALVRVHMQVNADLNRTLETEIEFIKLIAPMLTDYIPD